VAPSTESSTALSRVQGNRVTIRRDVVCDPASDQFSAASQVFLRFEPPGSGATTEFQIVGATLNGPPDCSALGDCLTFDIPNTESLDSMLPPASDGRGLAGPARILVRGANNVLQAEIGPLSLPPTDSIGCGEDLQAEIVFGSFTVLPEASDFAAIEDGSPTEMLATLDGNGNLLVPLNYEHVLAGPVRAPIFRILEGSAELPAFLSDPDPRSSIRVPSSKFLRSFTPTGRPIPPILSADDVGEPGGGRVPPPRKGPSSPVGA
jgi:hypothetical protein